MELPRELIHHIQSFLGGKEAAQTSLLSKSWYTAWSTRPTLDFHERDFIGISDDTGFPDFVRKTIEGRQKLNLSINNFSLSMTISNPVFGNPLANKSILDALGLGANDVKLENLDSFSWPPLPIELLAAANLRKLDISRCEIHRLINGSVNWSRLVSLHLSIVKTSDDIIRKILFCCPLIEDLILHRCSGVTRINVSKLRNLKNIQVSQYRNNSRTLIEFEERRFETIISRTEYRYLISLSLDNVEVDDMFLRDFSTKFPRLEYLSIISGNYGDVQISSNSLKHIKMREIKELKEAKFDVPNIQKFSFHVTNIPTLSFKTASKECDVSLTLKCDVFDAFWFLELRKFLTQFSICRSISLNITGFVRDFALPVEDILQDSYIHMPVVDNLMVTAYPSYMYSAFFSDLLWACRPKKFESKFTIV